jgi:hypothetical protein
VWILHVACVVQTAFRGSLCLALTPARADARRRGGAPGP